MNQIKDDIEKAIMKARERANDDGESVGPEGDNLDGKVISGPFMFIRKFIKISIWMLIMEAVIHFPSQQVFDREQADFKMQLNCNQTACIILTFF